MISSKGLLYIELAQQASAGPVRDHITRRMSAAFHKAGPTGYYYGGIHECVCGALSTNRDYRLPNGEVTNSLCVHYVAHHRSEAPSDQLARIGAFALGEVEPTADELQGPDLVLARDRASVENSLGADRLSTWTRWGLDVERLARALRGGRLPAMQGLSPARADAQDLLDLLCSSKPDSLSLVKTAVEHDHGDVCQWGARAVRVPGWDRGLWVSPLLALIQCCEGMERRSVAMSLRLLGPAAAAAGPTLLELAKRGTGDRDYDYDLSLALDDLGRILNVSLLAQIPPRPGQLGTCFQCHGSGDCYCRRKGMAHSGQCARCNGSGECHVCRGTGRRSP
jgi:hypothetical protein